jgi:hypothetical protein
MDNCAVFVVPRRHGWASEHGRSDQSYRNKLTHLRVSIRYQRWNDCDDGHHQVLIYINLVPEYGG